MACERGRVGWIAGWGAPRAIRALRLAPVVLVLIASSAGAEAPAAEPGAAGSDRTLSASSDTLEVPGRGAPRGSGRAGDPGLDDLLRLPTDFKTKPSGRPVAGASEDEWRKRFVGAEKAIGDARKALAATKKELDGLAENGGASQWSVAPPGAAGGAQQTTSPLSFKLRQQLQKERAALDEAERALRELRIEADLAGVPPEWRVVAANPSAPPTPN
ncbi:MAG: hypothetical protein U0900_00330 [Myxococcota bacterium]